jgi:hypothetical protein
VRERKDGEKIKEGTEGSRVEREGHTERERERGR